MSYPQPPFNHQSDGVPTSAYYPPAQPNPNNYLLPQSYIQPIILPMKTPGNGMAIAGLVLGIVGVVTNIIPCLWLFAIVGDVLAITFASIALYQSTRLPRHGASRGMAIAGLVLGIIGAVIYVVIVFVVANSVATILQAL